MSGCKTAGGACKCKRCTNGWHSRRHENAQPQIEARERYQAQRGPDARRRRAQERAR